MADTGPKARLLPYPRSWAMGVFPTRGGHQRMVEPRRRWAGMPAQRRVRGQEMVLPDDVLQSLRP
ncbi:hypothetical protein [Streptomyces fractus]|uniref:hypothetical protein n=1 Tax=Streptomyces fractus TaxID=641806 RepID=UPI003CF2E289